MIKVKDLSGKEIRGLYRKEIGLSVNDPEAYRKYIAERDRRLSEKDKISRLEEQVAMLSQMVTQLLKNNDKD